MTAETTTPPSPKAAAGKVKKVRKPRAKKAVTTADASVATTSRAAAGGRSSSGGKKSETAHRLRIKVRAYEHGILDKSVKQIIDTAARYNATVVGPVPLPIDIKKYTVNRAAFIDKDSREQFEMRIHKRMIDILNPAPKVIEALTNIDLPSGVSIDVKMM